MTLLLLTSGTLSIGLLFWILMIIWLVFGGWLYWSPPNYRPVGAHFFLWFLLFLLGWGTFGFPIGGR